MTSIFGDGPPQGRLTWVTRNDAHHCEFGPLSVLRERLQHLPIGAKLFIDDGPRRNALVGEVTACQGECDDPDECTKHWWMER